jgi:hypothetical protein
MSWQSRSDYNRNCCEVATALKVSQYGDSQHSAACDSLMVFGVPKHPELEPDYWLA